MKLAIGEFRVVIEAIGDHGCQREVKDGSDVIGCGSMRCPDCITAKYVADLERSGANVLSAKIQHWPGTPCEVVDIFEPKSFMHAPLATRKRIGSF